MSTVPSLGSNAHADLVQRYAAWEATLCENIATLTRQRALFQRVFVGGLLLSILGFFFGAWFGVGALVTGIAWCGTGYYLTFMRGLEYREELSRTRAQLRRLAVEQG